MNNLSKKQFEFAMNKKKHNLNESYLQSQTEEERDRQQREWSASEWQQYLCPNGTISAEEFRELGHKMIKDLYDELGWK